MSWQLSESIDFSRSRIPQADALRQAATAAEILRRFDDQPGVVLADEVGMGKTFVALAVAVSVVESTKLKKPVAVMVPASVAEKWRKEWDVFTEQCMVEAKGLRVSEPIRTGSAFLKLLDDPASRRKHVIVLTHGAMTTNLKDPFIKLSLLRQATKNRSKLLNKRDRIINTAPQLLSDNRFNDSVLVKRLLESPEQHWLSIWNQANPGKPLDDDPIPEALLDVTDDVDLSDLREAIKELPRNRNDSFDARLKVARKAINDSLKDVWQQALGRLESRLPLLILDEAHHVKNQTKMSGLFANPDAERDASALQGALGGVFDRMLFLTATPFQLGHRELLAVMGRFRGVRWTSKAHRVGFESTLSDLSKTLDDAQASALEFENRWRQLPPSCSEAAQSATSFEATADGDGHLAVALAAGNRALIAKQEAESLLRPWVIRHSKVRDRNYLTGAAIAGGTASSGLPIEQSASLPFLLAARAQALASLRPTSTPVRALYAYGLASSFEAYRSTRRTEPVIDEAEGSEDIRPAADVQLSWYLDRINESLPPKAADTWARHPKLAATVDETVNLWLSGEKVLIFCFYRATGHALRSRISSALRGAIEKQAAEALGLKGADRETVSRSLDRLADRLLGSGTEGRKALEAAVAESSQGVDPASRDRLADVVVRFMRTESFLVRNTKLSTNMQAEDLLAGFTSGGPEGDTLRDRVTRFADYLSKLVETERDSIFAALEGIQTGDIRSTKDFDPGEYSTGSENLLPNVRLANGGVAQSTRQRLMLGFNTPFFPEILVASQVMSEGVDLHTNCRHIIHHDLDWNPASLEQRTGRVDRLNSKSATLGAPITVYEPYLAGTHDEKMFRVVKDRERWFGVVMGSKNPTDERSTEAEAQQIPLPPALSAQLTMDLSLH